MKEEDLAGVLSWRAKYEVREALPRRKWRGKRRRQRKWQRNRRRLLEVVAEGDFVELLVSVGVDPWRFFSRSLTLCALLLSRFLSLSLFPFFGQIGFGYLKSKFTWWTMTVWWSVNYTWSIVSGYSCFREISRVRLAIFHRCNGILAAAGNRKKLKSFDFSL